MAKPKMGPLDWAAFTLVIIGALNWGLVGIGNFLGSNWDLVNLILAGTPTLRDVVYIIVGLAAVYGVYSIANAYK